MYPVTGVGLAVLGLAVVAAIGGWATSGITRLGRELGFVMGMLAGLAVALVVLPHAGGRFAVLGVLVAATVGGGLLGSAVLGGVGQEIARGLYRLRLGPADRLLGAFLSGLGALLFCLVALRILALVSPTSGLVAAARHDAITHWLIHNHTAIPVWL